jgi:hypothetical protein
VRIVSFLLSYRAQLQKTGDSRIAIVELEDMVEVYIFADLVRRVWAVSAMIFHGLTV